MPKSTMITIGIFVAILCSLAAGQGQTSKKKAGGSGDAKKGQALFEQCGNCHNADSDEKKVGPGLKGLFKNAKLASNGKQPTEENVRAKVDEGGNGMPPYRELLSTEEKNDLIAYLKTL